MIVMKFGGTSVQDAPAIRRMISIVRGRLDEKPLVVVSALSRVTRSLCALASEAGDRHKNEAFAILEDVRKRHLELCDSLLEGNPRLLEEAVADVEAEFRELKEFVAGVCAVGELTPRSEARIISTGEVLSSKIIARAMSASGLDTRLLDARRLIVTDCEYLQAGVDLPQTVSNVRRIVPQETKGCQVVLTQGFVASTFRGEVSVLGFEGSDYSAAIFGMALEASRVEIWTDVDGIRTADPRVVPSTRGLESVSYEEASAMASLGARVLHPLTIEPARIANIPILVLNSSNPEGTGSAVVRNELGSEGPKSVAFRTDIEYVELLSSRVTGAGKMLSLALSLAPEGISLISVSTSKASFTVDSSCGISSGALESLPEGFTVERYRDKAQISVVGNGTGLRPEVADCLSSVCKRVYMTASDPAFLSESIVVDASEVEDAVVKVHSRLL